MNFQQIVDEVLSITKRPDKIADIRREVNKAVNFFSIEANFARDRDEQLIVLDASIAAQSVSLSQFERLRKVETIYVPYSKEPLEHVSPDKLTTRGGCDVHHAFYIAGDNIQLKLAQTAVSAKIGFYKFPPLLKDSDTYWLLTVSPYMIIDRAAASIFNNIGDDASFRNHKALADEAYVSAKRDYKYGVSYGS